MLIYNEVQLNENIKQQKGFINKLVRLQQQTQRGWSESVKVRHTVKGKIIKRYIFILIRSRLGMSWETQWRWSKGRGRGGSISKITSRLRVPISRYTVLHSFMFSCHFQTCLPFKLHPKRSLYA